MARAVTMPCGGGGCVEDIGGVCRDACAVSAHYEPDECGVRCVLKDCALRTVVVATTTGAVALNSSEDGVVIWPCGYDSEAANRCFANTDSTGAGTACALTCGSNPNYEPDLSTGWCKLKTCESRAVDTTEIVWRCGPSMETPTKCYENLAGIATPGIPGWPPCATACSYAHYEISTADTAKSNSAETGKCTLKPCEARTPTSETDNWPCGESTETKRCYEDVGGKEEEEEAWRCTQTCTNPHFENTSTKSIDTGRCTLKPCTARTPQPGDWPCGYGLDVSGSESRPCVLDVGSTTPDEIGCVHVCSNPAYFFDYNNTISMAEGGRGGGGGEREGERKGKEGGERKKARNARAGVCVLRPTVVVDSVDDDNRQRKILYVAVSASAVFVSGCAAVVGIVVFVVRRDRKSVV